MDQQGAPSAERTSARSLPAYGYRGTTNADDSTLSEKEAEDFDPVLEYVLLGDSVSNDVLAWISVGVDMTCVADHHDRGHADGGRWRHGRLHEHDDRCGWYGRRLQNRRVWRVGRWP
ncbi:hypothetical protein PF005_g15925 [Phytophthora fragariae]|uniref:Uncharacterized protein n=4 Tax=Phytophthora TaxID=4783 RepID=A0A6A3RQL6_9STRA|nr:hypothetical protein PF003_g35473 [Phytophthora fragariae]KAE8996263.1 hypothetical protein PR002_g19367 [Phytophthora rubi]KAE8998571.1 hypothetical protein PF011_g14987 [Phytophthora fragariae]KAE9098401.1 hypothetical protein PF007_g16281 [Phytophthora fragariae]KAE9098689.1 hypothetical protein PF010_g15460 [Phytophthora fragariae]